MAAVGAGLPAPAQELPTSASGPAACLAAAAVVTTGMAAVAAATTIAAVQQSALALPSASAPTSSTRSGGVHGNVQSACGHAAHVLARQDAAPHRHHHAQRLAKHDCAHGPIARLPPHFESLGIDAQLAAVQVAMCMQFDIACVLALLCTLGLVWHLDLVMSCNVGICL